MEVVRLQYATLFRVEFLHAGYTLFQQNLVAGDIKIKPDKETSKLFINHNMDYKFTNGTLLCNIRTRQLTPPAPAPVIPYIKFTGNFRIRFLVYSSNEFLQKTQVIAAGKAEIYQFTNQTNIGTNRFIAMNETAVNNSDLKNIATLQPVENCFAVIDIHNNAAMNVSYDLFGAGNRLLNPAYRIRFVPNP